MPALHGKRRLLGGPDRRALGDGLDGRAKERLAAYHHGGQAPPCHTSLWPRFNLATRLATRLGFSLDARMCDTEKYGLTTSCLATAGTVTAEGAGLRPRMGVAHMYIVLGVYLLVGLLRVGYDVFQPHYNRPRYVAQRSWPRIVLFILVWPLLVIVTRDIHYLVSALRRFAHRDRAMGNHGKSPNGDDEACDKLWPPKRNASANRTHTGITKLSIIESEVRARKEEKKGSEDPQGGEKRQDHTNGHSNSH